MEVRVFDPTKGPYIATLLMKHSCESLKDEDTLRIFFGFLKNKVSTALPQTGEVEKCKHIESYEAPAARIGYWRKHRTYRAGDPLELVQSDDSIDDDDDEEEEEEEEEEE